jgi:hypothetical protein
LILTFTVVVIIILIISSVEALTGGEMSTLRTNAVLLKDTTTAQQFIGQDPDDSNLPRMYNSKNEPTGIECTYSLYLMVNPETFDAPASAEPSNGPVPVKHIFHRGFKNAFPAMAPGVFVEAGKNTLRIYMNTVTKWDNYVKVPNIPVGKWFHLVLNCYKNGLDIFVNGNLANRISFNGTIPYQNFQDLVIFSKSNYSTLSSPRISSIPDGETMNIAGSFNGLMSRLKYARYALSVAEIQKLMAEAPSTKRRTMVQETPPYMADSWWSNQG